MQSSGFVQYIFVRTCAAAKTKRRPYRVCISLPWGGMHVRACTPYVCVFCMHARILYAGLLGDHTDKDN